MAGFQLPRRKLNQPAFRAAVHASGVPAWQIVIDTGIIHHSKFSALVNAESVANTTSNVARLYAIADAIGFDRAQLFLESGR